MSRDADTATFITFPAAMTLYGNWRSLFRANGITRWVKRWEMEPLSDGRVKFICELSEND